MWLRVEYQSEQIWRTYRYYCISTEEWEIGKTTRCIVAVEVTSDWTFNSFSRRSFW